ncbi:MAG TPA: alkaline phosphatase family protein [Gemmatimonadaceae bacterium]
MPESSVIILVADGLTTETLDAAVDGGAVPELAMLREAGGRHVVTTIFPSVTGVAYVPLLTGQHPAPLGIPGLRWYDRSRRLPALLGHSRSYVGTQIRAMSRDLDRSAETAFELASGRALGMAALLTRGLPGRNRVDRGVQHAVRVIGAHVRGDVEAWAALEEALAARLVERIRREKPRFVFAAFTAGDKAAHAAGPASAGVMRSLKLVDHVAGQIRRDAERDGRWPLMHLCVVSDHGHAPVREHLDLASAVAKTGITVRSHPWTIPDRSDAAVMVSGNSMAHLYLGLDATTRRPWPELSSAWRQRLDFLWMHAGVDLIATLQSDSEVAVERGGERALIQMARDRFSYTPVSGNPLGIDAFSGVCEDEAHERTAASPYPDGVVQLARLVTAERSGDLVLSAAPGWDLRRRYEPIDHVSSHGALHAAHMLVPLTGSRRVANRPRRTADLFTMASRVLRR